MLRAKLYTEAHRRRGHHPPQSLAQPSLALELAEHSKNIYVVLDLFHLAQRALVKVLSDVDAKAA